jgi:hypothetical protein
MRISGGAAMWQFAKANIKAGVSHRNLEHAQRSRKRSQ